MYWDGIVAGVGGWVGFGDTFEDAGIPWRFTGILDNANSALVIAGRYRPPSALVRTFVYDSFSMLDDFVRKYRGYVGKVMDIIVEELRVSSMRPSRRAKTSGVNEG
jgi:hypothetical protein